MDHMDQLYLKVTMKKEEFTLREDYETKSSFTILSCKAEYKSKI